MTKDRKTRDIQVCCESFRDVVAACEGGAGRIELCSALDVGGLTPSFGLVSLVTQMFPELEISVLIRPRPGNFVYSRDELEQMERDIAECRRLEVDGVVVGALTATGDISKSACSRLVKAALDDEFFPPVDFVTFHRAFDVCRKPERALETLIELGFDRVLTSGQRATALEGAANIAGYIRQAAGRITIMPGCGITPANIAEIEAFTGANIFHASARGEEDIDSKVYTNPHVDFGENRPVRHTSAEIVQQLTRL